MHINREVEFAVHHGASQRREGGWRNRFTTEWFRVEYGRSGHLGHRLGRGLSAAGGTPRLRCPACKCEHLLAFFCQTRNFCPSCQAKRAALFAEKLECERSSPPSPTANSPS